jgi:hypothetical protein
MHQRFVLDTQYLRQLDPRFTSYLSEEQFTDVYYDSPSLQLYAGQNSVRHRQRVNLTNPDDPKSGRELLQIKLSHITDNPLERGEIKYPIQRPRWVNDAEDRHPLLGIVKPSYREPLRKRLATLGLNAASLRPVVTIHDRRQRIYILRDQQPFLSISLDHAQARIWWAQTEFVEIEPELNEIAFTDATPETRRYMEAVLSTIVSDLRQQFPFIESNRIPKYNKCLGRLQTELPALRLLVGMNALTPEALWATLLLSALVVVGTLHYVSKKIWRRAVWSRARRT